MVEIGPSAIFFAPKIKRKLQTIATQTIAMSPCNSRPAHQPLISTKDSSRSAARTHTHTDTAASDQHHGQQPKHQIYQPFKVGSVTTIKLQKISRPTWAPDCFWAPV